MGRSLRDEMERRFRSRGIEVSWPEARLIDPDFIRFHRSRRYQAMGVRKRYYTDTGDDVAVMAKGLRPGGGELDRG